MKWCGTALGSPGVPESELACARQRPRGPVTLRRGEDSPQSPRTRDGWRGTACPIPELWSNTSVSENRLLFVCLFVLNDGSLFFFIPFNIFKIFLKFYFKV